MTASLSGVFGSAFLICPAVDTDNPLLRWGHEAVLTFSSNSQLWVESRVSRMNYVCLDARVLSNTSAIIIETIEKTMPGGSIIRQREGETWSGRSPACPANPATLHMEGDVSLVCPSPLWPLAVSHVEQLCVKTGICGWETKRTVKQKKKNKTLPVLFFQLLLP